MGPDATSLIERAQRDGPSAAQREQIRRNVKAALAGGLGIVGASSAAAASAGSAGAAHGLGAGLTPFGLLGWLGAGSAVSAVVLGGSLLVNGPHTEKRPEPDVARAAAVMTRSERSRAAARVSDTAATPTEETSDQPGLAPADQRKGKQPVMGGEEARTAERPDSLRPEYALLAAAHRALEQGDTDAALLRLAEHERQFGDGRLTEERQGIRTLAVCRAGRPEAQAQAALFLRSFPHSLLGPRIRQQCHVD